MMSLWDALRMNMMISYQELVRTFPKPSANSVIILPLLKKGLTLGIISIHVDCKNNG